MRITFEPQRNDDTYVVLVDGDILTVNGVNYDFSPLTEGHILPHGAVNLPWLVSDVTRENGEITLKLILPHGADASEAARFPQPVNIASGPVEFPQ